ncbi:hypothetical protein FIBSPDRAFT_860656 [Athelia psychrophila]|uniref:Uncharacterized protein n=1 Tax=Athelia psychrophila TaxID=1759441 RepID=A0A166K2Z6_9AGAM|nr:hypothetical protein FIBSPDRAFT_860656 [Fibularhizoctonia sp. CBS 109695]
MDVSRIDPEEVLVDAATVEPGDGDVSIDNIDEALLRGSSSSNVGDQDQVLIDTNLTSRLNLRMDLSKPPNCPPRSRLCHP